MCHAGVVSCPAGEELSQLFVLWLQLRHVRRRRHMGRTWRRFHCLLSICSRCKVGKVRLDPSQALDVLFRSHGVIHVELSQLLLVLWIHRTATTLRLQAVDLLQKVDVDLEEHVDTLLLACLCAGRMRRLR